MTDTKEADSDTELDEGTEATDMDTAMWVLIKLGWSCEPIDGMRTGLVFTHQNGRPTYRVTVFLNDRAIGTEEIDNERLRECTGTVSEVVGLVYGWSL